MHVDIERRLISRTELRQPAKLLVSRECPFDVETIDISAGGIGLVTTQSLAPGTACAVAFEVRMLEGIRRINAWGAVVYDNDNATDGIYRRIGIAFVDMDAYSRHLLQRLGKEK